MRQTPARLARRLLIGLAGLALLALGGPGAAFGDDPPRTKADGAVVLEFQEGETISDLLKSVSRVVDTPIVWQSDDKAITTKRYTGMTQVRAEKGKVLGVVRALLVFQEVVLIPMGQPPSTFYVAMDARSLQSQFLLKMKAVSVELTDSNVDEYEAQDGLFITATIPVKNLDNLRDARTALQRLITQNNIGSVQEVPAARAFIVSDYAPNVATVYKTIRRMDVVPAGRSVTTEFFELRHANARNVARVLEELFGERRPASPAAPPPQDGAAPEARFSADPDSNQVVVIASEERIAAMRRVVEKIDRETTPPK